MFIIGDIEAFGYDTDFQELWGVFKENGTLKSILPDSTIHLYPIVKKNLLPLIIETLLSPYKPLKLSGKSTIVERFETAPSLQLGSKMKCIFANV